MSAQPGAEVRLWLQADSGWAENYVCSAPNNGHSIANVRFGAEVVRSTPMFRHHLFGEAQHQSCYITSGPYYRMPHAAAAEATERHWRHWAGEGPVAKMSH